jgi:5-methyltetrahydrofolate--homocysteine methyltransferase
MPGEGSKMADLTEMQEQLRKAVSAGHTEDAESLAAKLVAEGADPLQIIQEVLVPTLTEVGEKFQSFQIFLPELMAAGESAQAATSILENAIADSGKETSKLGVVILGTVENDVHDIGKNIVNTLLISHGFEVIDIGRDSAPSAFLEAARDAKADIVAMSATRSTIKLFNEVGERDNYKIIVGGGCVDQSWADEIGADGYAEDAAGAVQLCKQLLKP